MWRKRNNKGFTLVEIMMAVAIIAILAAVSFVGVVGYLRSMAQLERDAIAKEIFISAQNHLTMAEGQGYLGKSEKTQKALYGTEETPGSGIYYYVVNNGAAADDSGAFSDGVLGLMLPFGAIEETVRMGSGYIIRYQAHPAAVLDVFYSPSSGHRYMHTPFVKPDDASTMAAKIANLRGEDKKSARRNYGEGGGAQASVIGWYGGGAGLGHGEELKTPEIKVINAERLTVEVTDPNPEGTPLQLIITGVTSGAQKAIDIIDIKDTTHEPRSVGGAGKYVITLDDITKAGMRFRFLGSDNNFNFQAGENITIQAVSYRNDVLTNVAYSSKLTTNSLFADLKMESTTSTDAEGNVTTTVNSSKAIITNVRHLENLGEDISSVDSTNLKLNAAEQSSDLSWETFKSQIKGESITDFSIYFDDDDDDDDDTETAETVGYYKPVEVSYPLAYDGMGHRISDVQVNHTGNKGVFGTYGLEGAASGSVYSIQNLAIIDFKTNYKTESDSVNAMIEDAGALAGSVINTNVTNVIAYSSKPEAVAADNVITANGSAGGLIGSMTGGTITASAAALNVKTEAGAAGGLVGTVSGNASIIGCYAAGHTKDAAYYDSTVSTDPETGSTTATKTEIYNIQGTTIAGGLVGSAGGANISYSYSTCSASCGSGGITGGLIGSGSGSITNCYATGLVKGASAGAFAGAYAGAYTPAAGKTCTGNYYYEIINEREVSGENGITGFGYLSAVSGEASTRGITALDETVETYNSFCSGTADAYPYDTTLIDYYQKKYNLKTVLDLGYSVPDDKPAYIEKYFIQDHHGDWPAPETFVINTAGGGAAGG